ncbi:M16 family metallopeptidase [Magnetospirillum molischianum]|uniref:Putative Zn-dependent protease n=1 Tax=Magnetospirillum molischianum DSM 120 TaxID=1150626 RepID=H8FUL4_MAGML|nr:pitrilysin family protein [Magnetospirillum molischianum]CCG42052.1 putative Zn-dependent protease [Magnetospirillum molischianum DSM 120]
MKILARSALLLAALLVVSRPAEARLFDPQTFTLSNGMVVVVVPNHRIPIVSHMVWYKVGAADEVEGKSGLAHMLEHLMFKGTPSVPPGDFSKIVSRNGGRDNAFTSSDYTGYFQNVAADRLELVMRMEADRMANLTLDEDNFRTERAVVLEERRSRVGNNPAARLAEQMEASLFLNSPYRRPVIGWESEIAGLSREDALAFYRRWYAPNNAVLVVAGDVDAETVRPLAEKYYGGLARADTPPRLRTEEPPPEAARRVTVADPRVSQPSWSRLYLAPSQRTGESRLAQPLEVLAEIIGGGTTSILYRSLVVDQGLAAHADAAYDPVAVGLTSFRIGVVPRPGIGLDKLEAAIEREIARIARGEIPAEEVERAKTRLRASVVYARDSLHTGAQVLGEALAVGMAVEDVESWPDRVGAVTPAQVAEAAAKVLDARASVTGMLLPMSGAAPVPAALPAALPVTRGIR